MRQPANNPTVVQKGNDLFLRVDDEWFTYNLMDEPLGEGAMGTVYVGRSCRTGERVAVKRVIDKYANIPSIRRRAQLEASMLFRHKNLIEMIGYCELAPNKGPIFIISRLVQGITLGQHVQMHLRQRKDAVKKICECVMPVFDALEYIHSKGIVHLDIKPSNIMIENGCNVRLMDLGIAYDDQSATLINSAGLLGTPKYAAPEQYISDAGEYVSINSTTDIYELGVTVYELITGYNPYDSPTCEETMQRQRTDILPYVQGVPKEIINVLRKATAKQQSERYQYASEFKKALNDALGHEAKKENKWMTPLLVILFAIMAVLIIFILLL